MQNKITNEIYIRSIFQFQQIVSSVLSSYMSFDSGLSTAIEDSLSRQIEKMEILISEGRSCGDTFSTISEKKELFELPKTKLRDEIVDFLNHIPDEQKRSFYYTVLCMYSYNRYLSLHLLNVRALV